VAHKFSVGGQGARGKFDGVGVGGFLRQGSVVHGGGPRWGSSLLDRHTEEKKGARPGDSGRWEAGTGPQIAGCGQCGRRVARGGASGQGK
jgi:hypothetical protein